MVLCSLAIITYFLRDGRDGFHPFKTLIAPLLGAMAIAGAVYLMISNRATLTTGTLTGWAYWSPFIALGIFVLGCLLGIIYSQWSKERYAAVGEFLHEEA